MVDFVCERPVGSLGQADAFVPRQGGSLANIAVAAARFGACVEMIGGAGGDEWGRWLRERIERHGVGVERFRLPAGVGTSHAFVWVDEDGEPSFAFYGDLERPGAHAAEDLTDALSGSDGVLVVGSDTLLGQIEREVTMRAVALARERGWHVLCDPNLRPDRWDSGDEMVRVITDLVKASTVVKLNDEEARELSGCFDPVAAGEWLRGLGPDAVVITRGADGALIVTAEGTEEVPGVTAELVDATGAGDCVAGVVAAGLVADLGLITVVGAAMAAAAGVVSAWGATEGLPDAESACALLSA